MDNTLSNLKTGDVGEIEKIKTNSQIKQRLYDIGMIPGTKVKCLQKSMFGDPTAFLIKDTIFALRNQISSKVFVKTNPNKEGPLTWIAKIQFSKPQH